MSQKSGPMSVAETILFSSSNPIEPKEISASMISEPVPIKKFCYWTVADGNHGKMAAVAIASARKVGITDDFHVWTDLKEINDATTHPCGRFDKTLYMFKFHFLKNEVSKLPYEYFIFFDADNYFVKNPGDLTPLIQNKKVFIQMENDCSPYRSKRGDWWSCPIKDYGKFLREMGAVSDIYYNTNAGFWIVAKTAINEFYERTLRFFNAAHKRGYKGFTEEPALAFVGHIMQNPSECTLEKTSWLWVSDWTGYWKDKLPEYKEWQFEDYMSGDKKMVKSCIVHCMRSKEAMIKEYHKEKTIVYEGGYWVGHQLLGDVIGFVAAAHLMFVKTGKRQRVWFQESRKDILKYFEGVDWVPRESLPNAINAGIDPTLTEWAFMNGVKRFYKWMDPTLTNPKSFDIHMTCERKLGHNLIGLITHANTQGDIPNHIVDEMIKEAKKKYPNHQIVAIGNLDNRYLPEGVIDWRQSKGDINWIVETISKLDLLITPQTGPCFLAAGLKIPMWVYRSKESFWDNVLNYDTYKVERWWEREVKREFSSIYENGGWDHKGSGNGSTIPFVSGYIEFLQTFLKEYNIKNVLDLGCGDWQFSKFIDWKDIRYHGVDVVESVILENTKKYGSKNITFESVDFLTKDFPQYDLCIIKDVFQHLKNNDIESFKSKLKKFKYILITNDFSTTKTDIDKYGSWRPLDLLKYDFQGKYVYDFGNKKTFLVHNLSTKAVNVLGIDFLIRPHSQWDHTILYSVFHEYSITPNIKIERPEEYIIIDIGAHIGGFSKRIATLYPSIKVLSFEPDKDNFELLKLNTKGITNIEIFNQGIADKTKNGFLTSFDHTNSGMNVPTTSKLNSQSNIVSFLGINEILEARNKKVLFLKMDCEGGEWPILDTIEEKNLRRIFQIHCEFHTNCFKFWEPFKDYKEYDKPLCEQLVDKLVNKSEKIFNIFFSGYNALIVNKFFWI